MKKLTSLLLALVMLFTALTLSGCEFRNNNELKCGFERSGLLDWFLCAYKSETREFDIDDVTLTFSYGGIYNIMDNGEVLEYAECGVSSPSFELYFEDEEGNQHLIKIIEEELISNKYNVELNTNSWFGDDIIFCHSELITIPSDSFSKKEGYLFFNLGTQYIIDPTCDFYHNGSYYVLGQIVLYYRIVNDRVTLSCECEV